jgi:plasmid stability protein
MATQLTIRGVSDELKRRLARLSRDRGQSLNATALAILEEALDAQARRRRLARYATWTATDMKEFDRALADQRVIDDDLWQ